MILALVLVIHKNPSKAACINYNGNRKSALLCNQQSDWWLSSCFFAYIKLCISYAQVETASVSVLKYQLIMQMCNDMEDKLGIVFAKEQMGLGLWL